MAEIYKVLPALRRICWIVTGDATDRAFALASLGGYVETFEGKAKPEVLVETSLLVYQRMLEHWGESAIHPEVHRQAGVRLARRQRIDDAITGRQYVEEDGQWELAPDQIDGVNFLVAAKRGVLANVVGMGKTRTAAAAAWFETYKPQVGKPQGTTVVVAPKSVLYNWRDETLEHIDNRWPVVVIEGTAAERLEKLRAAPRGAMIVMSWNSMVPDADDDARMSKKQAADYMDLLAKIKPTVLIADEAQRLGNHKNKQAKAFVKLAKTTPCVYLLSGTPVDGRPEPWFGLLHTLDPERFSAYWRFFGMFVDAVPSWDGRYQQVMYDNGQSGLKNAEVFKDVLADYVLGRTWLEEDQIPVEYHIARVALPFEVRKLYNRMEEDYFFDLSGAIDGVMPLGMASNELVKRTRLRQLLVMPRLVLPEQPWLPAVKLDKAAELLRGQTDNAVIFVSLINTSGTTDGIVLHYLYNKVGLTTAYQPRILDTNTSAEERQEIGNWLREGERRVVILSTDTGGVGLNLQGASIGIFVDRPYSSIKNTQALGRLVRRGQKKVVQIYDIIADDTIDDHVSDVAARKEPMNQMVFTEEVFNRRAKVFRERMQNATL